MINDVVDLLECPHCRAGLELAERVVRCPNGHAFDVARQGYLNLSDRPPPPHADTPAMVAARDRVLTAGRFAPVAEALAGAAAPLAPRTVLDCGTGTGYYLAAVLSVLAVADPTARGVALDVSVPAVRRAARAHPRVGAVVSDAWQRLPLIDGALDLVLSVFAPRNPDEFHRVLRPAGTLLTVTPRPEHLAEIREPLGLIDIQDGKSERLADQLGSTFALEGSTALSSTTPWHAEAVLDVVAMGPNAFHHDPADLAARVAGLSTPVRLTVAVQVSRWTRR